MPDLELLRIDLRSARGYRREFEQEMNAIGIDQQELRKILEEEMEEIGEMAFATYQSAVPIRTGQLRNCIKLRSRNRVEKVIILQDILHTAMKTSRSKSTLSFGQRLMTVSDSDNGPGLSHYLHDGISRYGTPFHRRRSALRRKIEYEIESTKVMDPTMSWADNAYNAFDNWLVG